MPEVLRRISGLSLTIDKSKSLGRFPHSYHCKMDYFFSLQLLDSLAFQAEGEEERKGVKTSTCQSRNHFSFSLSNDISPVSLGSPSHHSFVE